MSRGLSQKTLFIRNIDYNVTADELTNLFKKYGEIKSTRILTEKFHGKYVSRGIGFVEFVNVESFSNAYEEKNSIELYGRTLKIVQAFVRKEHKKDTAFIAGIPENTSNEEILNSLAKFNAKNALIVKYNHEKKKGFAFVQFNSKEDRDNAVSMKTFELNGEESLIRNAHYDFDSKNNKKKHNVKATKSEKL